MEGLVNTMEGQGVAGATWSCRGSGHRREGPMSVGGTAAEGAKRFARISDQVVTSHR